ncbi:glycosyltransferase family 2 protein [Halomonas sp. McH1-25]|uniref:glycosyltransferase family 2 protein n=1 Tax=unclassified Halomonas TaxID=2609666 RepID=UPI001EF5031D|nr:MULTISPECIES: glycosyltransferase family 2 protein [unclassified Halomonas]MCG7600447.1 glycosyltransferase family 2 protein [Halomonas sp. McH1-25]MCP1344659.1 glycosyltransferase family 2 protein [Halomonas sp. FL8]MCP1363178.1 glycosyltransferase family 2 protein [Halomonas sp. BBD45]
MKISLVVPVFNEEDTLPLFHSAVRESTALSDYEVEIVIVNDGSVDGTSAVSETLAKQDEKLVVVEFSRNFGKEQALFAGLEHASGEAVIPIDVDLQDPIDIIPVLIERWQAGSEVVLAKRVDRKIDSYFKRRSAELFYRLHNKISEPRIEENVGDFRLMSRQVVNAILTMPERKLFMKGVLSWVGFKTEVVEYVRAERVAGETKFNGWKLWNLALEGITSFSTFPLRVWTYLGFGVALLSLLYALWMIVDKLLWGNPVPGYPSLMTAVLFLGGIQLIGIGVLGEYIGRIYIESKRRPRYIVSKIIKNKAIMK